MANTILSSGVRNNLLTLQQTTAQQSVIQNRLATGKKVNSAIDNPVNYFTSFNLNDRGEQLTGLLDGISNGIQTITAASKGIDSITKLVSSLQSTVKQAQNEAAANRPTVAGTLALGKASEATATNSTIRDVALSKLVQGAVSDATAALPGNAGLAAGSTTIRLTSASPTPITYDITIGATTTVRDLVENINKSGIATASVGNDGKLSVIGTGSDALSVEAGSIAAGPPPVFTAAAAAQNELLFGTGTVTTAVTKAGSSATRTSLVQQFNDLRDQIDALAKDASFNGINLLGGDRLSITLNEKTGSNKNKIDVQGDMLTAESLGIGKANNLKVSIAGEFSLQNDNDLNKAADALTNAISSLRATSSSLGSKLAVVQTRQDFTKELVNTLTIGADKLVAADPNEEGASLLALNTRQQLSQTALSLANQADQGVLRLFG
ncbi:flagellin N-terminal helical domain-containing protein [Bosea sp. 2RAB26]|uniref:flagellin N-terminal helical domain-containing protein n=1 Tax=Bosea sp. 2RAB26 TaxID=3237476 RepID=UPI003F903A5C